MMEQPPFQTTIKLKFPTLWMRMEIVESVLEILTPYMMIALKCINNMANV